MKRSVPIVAFTPNLALGRTLELDRQLTPEKLHRVRVTHEAAGGGGVNLARVVTALGGEVIVAGFLAGWNGQKFQQLLSNESLPGIFRGSRRRNPGMSYPARWSIPAHGGVRVRPSVSIEDWAKLFRKLLWEDRRFWKPAAGITPDIFRSLLREFPRRPVVDTSGPTLVAALEASCVSQSQPGRACVWWVELRQASKRL